MGRRSKIQVLVLGSVIAWLAFAGLGVFAMHRYESTAGAAAVAPMDWPGAASHRLDSDRFTLVIFLHPRCPCSRATVEELSELIARAAKSGGRLAVTVWMNRPEGAGEGWEHTDLWQRASAIPGVRVVTDACGAEARRFGAATSGQAMLYDPTGKLLFSGGITGARGHSGENAGFDAVLQRFQVPDAMPTTQTPVYGCELFAPVCKSDPSLHQVAAEAR
jgi:hypothetical protein